MQCNYAGAPPYGSARKLIQPAVLPAAGFEVIEARYTVRLGPERNFASARGGFESEWHR
jgi:hypothetical protein